MASLRSQIGGKTMRPLWGRWLMVLFTRLNLFTCSTVICNKKLERLASKNCKIEEGRCGPRKDSVSTLYSVINHQKNIPYSLDKTKTVTIGSSGGRFGESPKEDNVSIFCGQSSSKITLREACMLIPHSRTVSTFCQSSSAWPLPLKSTPCKYHHHIDCFSFFWL